MANTAQSILNCFKKYKFSYQNAVKYICTLYPDIQCISDSELFTFIFNDGSKLTCDAIEKTYIEYR